MPDDFWWGMLAGLLFGLVTLLVVLWVIVWDLQRASDTDAREAGDATP